MPNLLSWKTKVDLNSRKSQILNILYADFVKRWKIYDQEYNRV